MDRFAQISERIARSTVAADPFFDPEPDWDYVRFPEDKHWVFKWKDGGGWNEEMAKSKREALAMAKRKWKGTEWEDRIDEDSFHVPTRQEYRSLLRMFD